MSAESERLVRGPRPGERPGGLGLTRMNFVADGDAAAVVDRAREGDLVITMGAGSVTKLGPGIVDALSAR